MFNRIDIEGFMAYLAALIWLAAIALIASGHWTLGLLAWFDSAVLIVLIMEWEDRS
jgi:hypothetical protein